MSASFVFFLVCGAASGGFINGLAGFGTALFALGFWLQVLPPVEAVALALVMSVASGFQGIWLVRHTVMQYPARVLQFVVPALFGIPLGVLSLSVIDAGTLKLMVAVFLIVYGSFFTFRRKLPTLSRQTPILDSLVGLAGGVLGGASGLSGALPTMWCAMRPWTKQETRAVVQTFNMVILSVAIVLFALKGVFTRDVMLYIAIAIPVTLLCAQIGITIFKRLNDAIFRRLVILLMLGSGFTLLIREMI